MTAIASFDDGIIISGDPVQFTTGELPDGDPVVTLTTSQEMNTGGITFFGLSNQLTSGEPAHWGADEGGEIIWYLSSTQTETGTPVLRSIEPGVMLVFFQNPMGDVDELINGNILVCAAGGRTTSGLNISEISKDESGDILWSVSINKNVYRAERTSQVSFLKIR